MKPVGALRHLLSVAIHSGTPDAEDPINALQQAGLTPFVQPWRVTPEDVTARIADHHHVLVHVEVLRTLIGPEQQQRLDTMEVQNVEVGQVALSDAASRRCHVAHGQGDPAAPSLAVHFTDRQEGHRLSAEIHVRMASHWPRNRVGRSANQCIGQIRGRRLEHAADETVDPAGYVAREIGRIENGNPRHLLISRHCAWDFSGTSNSPSMASQSPARL